MKTNNKTLVKIINAKLEKKTKNINLNEIALSVGYIKHVRSKKVSPYHLMIGFFSMAFMETNSFMSWAIQVSHLIGDTVSKQAIWKRMNERLVMFLNQALTQFFSLNMSERVELIGDGSDHSSVFLFFKRVLLQDSTYLKLPDVLSKWFPGNFSCGIIKAVAKLQTIYDAKDEIFAKITLGSFSDNDQGASGDILQTAKKGDLVLRDLGYFVLRVFRKMTRRGIFFLSRLKYGVAILDRTTGQSINLLQLLKNQQSIDIQVYIGAKEKVAVRLVAVRVPEEVAAGRRRKLKTDRDKRKNPSKEYLALLDWTLFITNVPKEIWTINQIVKAYRLRWRIEMIFKSWKSYFNIASLVANISANKIRVEAVIYYMLIFILLFHVRLYRYFLYKLYYLKGIVISLMKFSKYICENLDVILRTPDINIIEKQVEYYCRYDTRNDRSNYWQLLHQI